MITLDINKTHGLALVVDGDNWRAGNPHYVALTEAPALGEIDSDLRYTYLRQLHYIAGHGVNGLFVVDHHTPRDGWTHWRPGAA